MASRSDNFDRADNAAALGSPSDGGGGYTVSGTWGISSNQAYNPGNDTYGYAFLDAGSSDPQTVQVTLAVAAIYTGVCGRVAFNGGTSTYDYFWVAKAGAGYELRKRVNNSDTSLGTGGTASSGDVLVLDFSGTAVTVKANGTTIITATDSLNQTTGNGAGLWCYQPGTTARWDDLSVTVAGGGGGGPPAPPPALAFTELHPCEWQE